MKTKLLLITAVLLYFTSFSQVNKMYSEQGISNLSYGGIDRLSNNNYIFSIFGYDITVVDENGVKIDSVIFSYDKFIQSVKAFAVKDTNVFVATGFYNEDSLNAYISLSCYNNNLDSIWQKNYLIDTVSEGIGSIINTSDNGFLIIGKVDKGNYKYDGFALKLDSNGIQKWYNEYGTTSNNEYLFKAVETPDNGYILLYRIYLSTYEEQFYAIRIDSLGNQIWDWLLFDSDYTGGLDCDLIKTNNGNYIAVANSANPNDIHNIKTAQLIEFDINKNIINNIYFHENVIFTSPVLSDIEHSSYFSLISQKENGNYIVISNQQPVVTYNTDMYYSPILYELDTNFNIIKRREYRSVPSYYYDFNFREMHLNNDGSVAMIGDATLPGGNFGSGQTVWLVITDTNYCDGFGSCDTTFNLELNYPDSICKTDTINLTAEIISDNYIEYNFTLSYYYQKNGNMVFITRDTLLNVYPNQVQQIPISYDIFTEKYNTSYVISDSIFTEYEMVPSDSVSHLNKSSIIFDNHFLFYEPDSNIYVPELEYFGNISLYPNPTNSDIQLKIDNNKLLGSKIEIIDINSKVIKEQIINNLITKIDLSKEEKGIYFIKIINNKGIITKKIVLE